MTSPFSIKKSICYLIAIMASSFIFLTLTGCHGKFGMRILIAPFAFQRHIVLRYGIHYGRKTRLSKATTITMGSFLLMRLSLKKGGKSVSGQRQWNAIDDLGSILRDIAILSGDSMFVLERRTVIRMSLSAFVVLDCRNLRFSTNEMSSMSNSSQEDRTHISRRPNEYTTWRVRRHGHLYVHT